MKNLLLSCFFFAFLMGFSSLLHATSAPTSLVGKKLVLSIPDQINQRTYGITFIFTSSTEGWEFAHGYEGEWRFGKYTYSASGNTAVLESVPNVQGGSYLEITTSFLTPTTGNMTYKDYEINSSGILELEEEGSATFTMSDYSNSDLPPLDTYFSDDFTSVTTSQNYWYDNIETTRYGLQLNVGDGELELTGTGTDPSELSFNGNAKALISVDKDWIIQADAYANYPATGSESWDAKVGFEIEDSGLEVEFFIGPSSWGTHAHLNFDDSLSGNVHLSTTFDSFKQGTYRIRNDTASKTFYAETLSGSTWNTVMSVNWETGAVSGATYSSSGSTSQLSNWVSMASKYVQPGVDFMIPSDNGTVKTLSENQLGFDSFSITSTDTSSGGGSVTAPTSLVGKEVVDSFYDSSYQEQLTDTSHFFSDSEFFGRLEGTNSGLIDTYVRSYQWSSSSNEGTAAISPNATWKLLFDTETSGTTSYTTTGGSSSSGTFTLNDSISINVPSSLVGKILTESIYDEGSSESFTQIMYFQSDTELLEISEGEVSGLHEIYDPSYTFSVTGNIATLKTTLGSETATYTLLFTSETSGYSDYSNSYSDISDSSSFTLSDSTGGYSPIDLVDDQMIIDGTTYSFKANNVCTIGSGTGSSDSTYRFIKTGENTAVLSIPADHHSGGSILKLTFSSISSGTISKGGTGNFSYYPEGTIVLAPSSLVGKNFVESWFDSSSGEQLTETIHFFSDSQFFGRLEGSLSGLMSTIFRNYQWSTFNNQGTVVIPPSGDIKATTTIKLLFNSETTGDLNYTGSDGYTSTGTFTLNDSSSINVPSSLVGKILTESFYDESSSENFSQIMYFQSDTKLLEIQEGEVSGLYNIHDPSYTFSVTGNIATLKTTIGTDTATYTLLFTSETAGYSDYSNSYSDISDSGSFTLSDSTGGYSPSDLVDDQMIIDGVTYVFKANNVCTIRSSTGSSDSTYRLIKTGQNTAVLSIPADDSAGSDSVFGTADDVIANKYKLTFSSISSGTISKGETGNFSYYPEGTSAPSTKGWMWFDQYPWVYSHIEGGWLYFNPSGSKLMVYSSKDKAWREMSK